MRDAARRFHAFPVLALVLGVLAGGPLAAQERYTLRGDRVAVHNLAGEVRVVPGEGREVVVEVARGGEDARRLRVEQGPRDGAAVLRVVYPDDDLVYPRMRSGSRSTLRVRRDGTFGGGEGSRRVTVRGRGRGAEAYADLRILVPAGRSLSVHQGVGKVEVENVDGELRIHTASAPVVAAGTRGSLGVDVGSGSVRVAASEGDVDVDTGSGSVQLASVRGRRVRVDTGSGSVHGAGVRADALHVDVGSGAVELTGIRAEDVDVDTGSGSVRLELADAARTVRIDTGSGSVRLAVPASFGAEVQVKTGSGGIHVDAPARVFRSRRSHFHGRIGDGEGRVEIDTGSGGVRITRS